MTHPNNRITGSISHQDNYKLLFDKTPISIVLVNSNGQIVDINSATENIFGFERKDLIGFEFSELYTLPAADKIPMNKVFDQLLKGGIFGPEDIQIYDKHKNLIWVNVIASKIEIEKKIYIQVLTTDISQRKILEQEVYESEKRYRGLYDASPNSLTVVNSKGVILNVNSATEKIFGYTKREVIGKKYTDLGIFSPEQIEMYQKNYKEALAGKKIEPHDIKIKRKDGTFAWINVQNSLKKINNEILLEGIAQDITDRKKTEKKLRESKERYRNLADSLPEVIFEVDLKFKLVYTNAIASKIFGYSHEEFKKGLNALDFVLEEDRDEVIRKLSLILRGKTVDPVIIQLKKKDGTIFYGRLNIAPIYKDTKIIGFRSVVHDVTEMVKAEERIKESEEQFRTISEQSLMGITIIQEERVKYVNKTFTHMIGYSISEMLNWGQREFYKSIHPEDKKKVIEFATKSENQDDTDVQYYEARGIHKDGSTIWFEIYNKRILFQNKPAFLVTYVDITEKKKAKEELRQSEEKYRFLFEKSPISILLINTQGKIEDCNPALEKLVKYERSELIGKRYGRLPIVPPDYLPILLERLKKIANGEVIPSIDIQLRKKDGNLVWVNIGSSLVKLGEKTYIMVMGHDISDTKEVEIKLKELNEMRKEFIDRASHELKTPITTVYGAYQLLDLLHKDKFDPEQLELLEMAAIGTKRIKKLVDDLLDVSLMESKTFKVNKSRSNLSNIIINCIKEMKYFSNKRNHEIDIDILPELYMNIDESRIELVFTNLISNAIKYTPSNGKIQIKMQSNDKFAQIKISDSGVGLSSKEIKNLFRKFSTIESPLKKDLDMDLGSTGLGLFLSKEIIELHGGEIWAESEGKGKGSTFIVKIPIGS